MYLLDHVAHHDDQLPLVSVPDATTATQFGDEAQSNRQTRRGTIRDTHIPKSSRNTECTVCFVSKRYTVYEAHSRGSRPRETVCAQAGHERRFNPIITSPRMLQALCLCGTGPPSTRCRSPQMSAIDAEDLCVSWIRDHVIRLGLCPYAATPMTQEKIRYYVSDA